MGYVWSKFQLKIKLWDSWEDEYAVDVMRLGYRGFHRIGFVVLDLSPEYAKLSLISAFIGASSLLIATLSLLTTCSKMSDDFEECSGVCNLGFLAALALSFMINHSYYRKSILSAHGMLGKGFHDYQEPEFSSEELEKYKNMLRKQSVALIILACYVAMIGVLVVVVCPLIDESLGFGWTEPYDKNGVNRQLPVPIWLPFPTHEGVNHWFTVLYIQSVGGAMICLSIGGTALLFTSLTNGLMLEQKRLILSIKNIEKRARHRFKALYKGMPGVNENGEKIELIDDVNYQKCITYCFRQNVIHHQSIITFTALFLEAARAVLLLAFFVETMAIAMSMVKLNEGSNKWGANLAFACITIAEVANMVMLCYLGESVISGSNEINEELYFTEWYRYNIENRKCLLQFLMETRTPIVLNALNLVVCNMEQFSSVMNTAYSFFNMIKLSKIREDAAT